MSAPYVVAGPHSVTYVRPNDADVPTIPAEYRGMSRKDIEKRARDAEKREKSAINELRRLSAGFERKAGELDVLRGTLRALSGRETLAVVAEATGQGSARDVETIRAQIASAQSKLDGLVCDVEMVQASKAVLEAEVAALTGEREGLQLASIECETAEAKRDAERRAVHHLDEMLQAMRDRAVVLAEREKHGIRPTPVELSWMGSVDSYLGSARHGGHSTHPWGE